jgi:hypothetical protein
VASSVSIDVSAHDLAPAVEAEGQGPGPGGRAGIGMIDRGEDAVVQHKTVACSVSIKVAAHDPAAAVDSEDRGLIDGIGVIDGGEDIPIQKRTVADERGGVAVVAAHHHLHAARSHHLRLGRCRSPGLIPGILPPGQALDWPRRAP